jgi:hypothetical protein
MITERQRHVTKHEHPGGREPLAVSDPAKRIQAAADAGLGIEAARIWEERERLGVDGAVALVFGTKRARAFRA